MQKYSPPFFNRYVIQRSRVCAISRALAGMALAIVVALAAVTAELSSDLRSRHAIYTRRIARAQLRLEQIDVASRNAATTAAGILAQVPLYDELVGLLSRSDLQLIRVTAPIPSASGVILFSPATGRALLAMTGLSGLESGQHYRLAITDSGGTTHVIARFDTPVGIPVLVDLSKSGVASAHAARVMIVGNRS